MKPLAKQTDFERRWDRPETAATMTPMEEKARRILADGRLSVLKVDRDRNHIFAVCKGDHGTYKLGYNGAVLDWSCDCPAYGECSHLMALKLVTAPFAE